MKVSKAEHKRQGQAHAATLIAYERMTEGARLDESAPPPCMGQVFGPLDGTKGGLYVCTVLDNEDGLLGIFLTIGPRKRDQVDEANEVGRWEVLDLYMGHEDEVGDKEWQFISRDDIKAAE